MISYIEIQRPEFTKNKLLLMNTRENRVKAFNNYRSILLGSNPKNITNDTHYSIAFNKVKTKRDGFPEYLEREPLRHIPLLVRPIMPLPQIEFYSVNSRDYIGSIHFEEFYNDLSKHSYYKDGILYTNFFDFMDVMDSIDLYEDAFDLSIKWRKFYKDYLSLVIKLPLWAYNSIIRSKTTLTISDIYQKERYCVNDTFKQYVLDRHKINLFHYEDAKELDDAIDNFFKTISFEEYLMDIKRYTKTTKYIKPSETEFYRNLICKKILVSGFVNDPSGWKKLIMDLEFSDHYHHRELGSMIHEHVKEVIEEEKVTVSY